MIVRRNRKIGNPRYGATAVEFALVFPVFILMFFGIVEIGRGFMVKGLLDNVARKGCRIAILQGKANSDVTSEVSAVLSSLKLSSTTTTIKVNSVAADVSTARTGDLVSVTISVSASNITWLPSALYLKGTFSGICTLPHG